MDVIDGAAGTDTLNVQDTATAANAAFSFNGATIKNVETLALSTSGFLKNLDLSGATGLNTVSLVANSTDAAADNTGLKLGSIGTTTITAQAGNVSVASGGKQISITAAGTATIEVGATGAGNNTSATSLTLKTGSGTVKAYGSALTDVTVNGGGAVTVDNTDATGVTGAGSTLTSVTLNNDAGATLTGKGLTTVTLSNQGAAGVAQTVGITNGTTNHALTINAAGTGYKTDGSKFSTVVNDTGAASLTVNTSAKSALNLSGSNTATKLTLTGAGALDLSAAGGNANVAASVTAIDGSAATGNLTLGALNAAVASVKTGAGNDTFAVANNTAKVTVDTGAGNDVVYLKSALTAGSTVALGAGDDKLLFATGGSVATSTTATSVIDGGDGVDTVSANLINAGDAALFKNFEHINLDSTTGLDLALLAGNNTISGLSISSASTTATYQNVTQSMGLNVDYVGASGGVNTLSMTGVSGASDSYTVTFSADNSAAASAPTSANVGAGTVILNGIETVNVVSGGTKAWNSITLTDTAATKLVVTGAANADIGFATNFGTAGATTGVSQIDASAATGKVAIDLANVNAAAGGLTVLGGSAADTITTSTFASTLTGGAGADTFDAHLAVTTAGAAPVLTTITDIAAGDVIKLSGAGSTGTAAAFSATKVVVSTATALSGGTVNALDLAAAAAGAGDVNNKAVWFQYAGDTYILDHTTSSTTAYGTGDQVIKLVGLHDLSTASGVDAGATLNITIA